MSDRKIALTVGDDRVELRTQDDAVVSGPLGLDLLQLDLLKMFQSWLSQGKLSKRQEFEILGRVLFKVLFNGDVQSLFEQELAEARNKKRQLRIQLSFDDKAAKLAGLPWEYLYYAPKSASGVFLSTHVDLVLSRHIPLRTGRQTLIKSGTSPLRLLVVASQPSDVGTVLVEPVIEAIKELAAKHPIQIEHLNTPTVDQLLYTLEAVRPHVLHFIGHGRFNRAAQQGEIALLASDETSSLWVRDSIFAEYFSQMGSVPRVVLLHLCEGGAVDFEANLAGLAPQLILTGVQAVVAMQHTITNLAAIVFSRAFYRELALGKPIDYAVQRGRWRITTDIPGAYDNHAFGSPTLFMSSWDGVILPPEPDTASPGTSHE